MHNSVHTVKKHTEKTIFWHNVAKVNQNYYFIDITLVTLAEEKEIDNFSIDLICQDKQKLKTSGNSSQE
jgi:hypothetical protein